MRTGLRLFKNRSSITFLKRKHWAQTGSLVNSTDHSGKKSHRFSRVSEDRTEGGQHGPAAKRQRQHEEKLHRCKNPQHDISKSNPQKHARKEKYTTTRWAVAHVSSRARHSKGGGRNCHRPGAQAYLRDIENTETFISLSLIPRPVFLVAPYGFSFLGFFFPPGIFSPSVYSLSFKISCGSVRSDENGFPESLCKSLFFIFIFKRIFAGRRILVDASLLPAFEDVIPSPSI